MSEVDLKLDIAELRNVEIVHTGNFNRFNITNKVLDDIVANFENKIYQPVLTINHKPDETKKLQRFTKSINLGIVESLKKVGEKLFADFVKVPRKVAEMIESGRLLFRSIELKPVHAHANGGTFQNVLTGVTFHGGADGSSALTDLSNDFDAVGLKLFENTTEQSDSIVVEFKEKVGDNMSEITVDKKEWNELQKTAIDFKVVQNENVELKKANKELEEIKLKVEDLEAIEKEHIELKEQIEKDKAEMIKNEAETFVNKMIEDKKLQPKFKDMEVESYIRYKSEGDEKLKLFKEKLSNGDDVVDFGNSMEVPEGVDVDKIDFDDNDAMQNAIEKKMKAENISWDEAALKLGVLDKSEVEVE